MQNLSHKTYWFEGFILDLERACLKRDRQEIKLRPKSFESLKYLIENRGRLVTKDQLMHAVWPDSFVTDDSLVQCVRDIRRSLGDNSQHFIKTVPRRGYIFEAEVIENGLGTNATIHTKPAGGSRLVAGEEEPAAPPGRYVSTRDLERDVAAVRDRLSGATAERAARAPMLPVPRTRLIGRERESEIVSNLLLHPEVRLVTLTGAGGSGKTRLALQVAVESSEGFKGGVWFVSLGSIYDARLVPFTIAEALGVRRRRESQSKIA